ncbi:thiamine diphosphokinase [Frigoriflavimonas asaccharolytica]|uniref:Thiamine diphosphokinase n=1 Tax=Frigoriflavimonas asaccharolytica TaxID=2735899 RepID=A0A8J8G8Q4_9FLAO|nr:thiamine diphosphokinase [Frigoriflavimonas asaccharolytica]NRS92007.1 thiamine pyrophosphokinase [Frigoriflavimonas asaccharolytica]
MKKALLFLNGEPPKCLPNFTEYNFITCTDGAFLYLKERNFPVKKLDFISGDFDKRNKEEEHFSELIAYEHLNFIHTPDQNKTDFEKNLEILIQKKITDVDIYGGSGKEMDHFLGNLSVALKFKDQIKITFFDEFSSYFFAEKQTVLEDVKDKMISLYPFPSVENITTKGLNWELENATLNQLDKISTRNFAKENLVEVTFEEGNLLIFVDVN